ncbi:MAG: D-alanine--D-alanine ligase [Oscillospiraceae bacterium]|nr:D-alanine--D-alanine ligase [Oscillospiraceae bacterium]
MSKLNLAVLFGGASSEYEISLRSSASVLRGLDTEKYNITVVGITKGGDWYYLPEVTPDEIEKNDWESLKKLDCTLSLSRKLRGLYIYETGETIPVDVIFPVMHGENAEDGRLQGACELAGIPCVGPGCASSAVCMDKSITKLLAATTGVAQADWLTVTSSDFKKLDIAKIIEEKFSYPVFVKPTGTGSSVGAAKAGDRASLLDTLSDALKYGGKALVEEFIPAREIETAALGNDNVVISVCGEVLSETETYSYESKYSASSASKTVAPADLPADVSEKIRAFAEKIYRACSCRGLSRVDFFIHKETGEIIFNEINTIPGFTSISMYAKLFDASGIPFSELLDKIIACATEE